MTYLDWIAVSQLIPLVMLTLYVYRVYKKKIVIHPLGWLTIGAMYVVATSTFVSLFVD